MASVECSFQGRHESAGVVWRRSFGSKTSIGGGEGSHPFQQKKAAFSAKCVLAVTSGETRNWNCSIKRFPLRYSDGVFISKSIIYALHSDAIEVVVKTIFFRSKIFWKGLYILPSFKTTSQFKSVQRLQD